MPSVQLNGIDLNYQIDGDGDTTLLLINGLADDLASWDFQVPALVEAGIRVVRFDNRGIGLTSAPAGPYTSRMLADDAKGLADHLQLTDYHLVGVSMGGMIAQEYALAYGSDLKSLTLACTYAAPGPFCSRMFAMWGDLAPQLGVPFVMRDVSLWAFTVPFFEERESDAAEFEAAMAELPMSVEAYLSQLNVIQQHDTTDRLGQISVPTLVVVGEEDILIPVRLSKRLHAGIPGAEWAEVPGGHACLWEFPDPLNTALISFIDAH